MSRNVLEGGNTGPFRRRFLSRLARSLRPAPAVKVEQLNDGLAPTVLYAPSIPAEGSTYVETKLVSDSPDPNDTELVYSDIPYEIRAAGMFVKSFDRFSSKNELLLYSIQTDPNTPSDAQSLPFIHFDFSRDATTTSEKPNTFLQIPASKSFVMACSGKQPKTPSSNVTSPVNATPLNSSTLPMSGDRKKFTKPKYRRSVNVQFRILEIDEPSQTIQDAVAGIKDLGGLVSGFGTAVPFLGVLNPALSMVSTLSKRALDSYAMPDKVISIDMDFMIANRKRVIAGTAPAGEYLRFGYYFFLEEPVEGKLYASVRTPDNLTLMLKRSEDTSSSDSRIEARTYFPLTEVSYLVVRVSEPTDTNRTNRRPIQMNHARMLEDLFQRAKPGEDDPANIRDSLYELGLALGVFESEDDDSDTD